MRTCISEATTMSSSFAEDVANYADVGCEGMEVWLTKLEKHLEQNSLDSTRKLVADRNLALPAAAYQGGLLLSQGDQRKAHFDHFKRRLDLCQQFGIPTLIVLADFNEPVDAVALDRAFVSLKQAAQWAAGFDVRLAFEFRAKNSFCASLDSTVAFLSQCGETNVGVCFDAFHYYTGPSKFEDLGLLNAANLFHVQLSDLAGTAREWATDADRILPGDGDWQLGAIVSFLKQINYDGWVSLEMMNPTLWQAGAKQVAEIGLTALRKLCSSASGAA